RRNAYLEISFLYSSSWMVAWGRGPTKDISPRNTFRNCGSSSMLDRRSQWPSRVTRLSLRVACFTSDPCSITVIVRNLKIKNSLLLKPLRSCKKNTGPRESSLIRMAAINMVGANVINARLESAISNARLMAHSLQGNGPRCRATTHVQPISFLGFGGIHALLVARCSWTRGGENPETPTQ